MEPIPATTPKKKATPSKPAFVVNEDGYTRLHITPLDPELFPVVVPAAARPLARNLSYHSIEAFPERRYGFVDLPQPDAEKLKKKLHGAVLKGVKMRVEPARPESLPEPTGDVPADPPRAKKPKKEKKDKKRKRDEEVVEGVAIHDRKIKRGWTVTEGDMIKEKRKDKEKKSKDKKEKKDKKSRKIKSKYTDGPECLFKQKLPEVPGTKDAADTTDAPKRKKRKGDRELVIHEFSQTNKVPTFLKSTIEASASEPLTFEDGKGWVNAEGDVVEPMKITRPATPVKTKSAKKNKRKRTPEPEPEPEPAHDDDDDDTSSSGSSSESESEAETAPTRPKLATKAKVTQKSPEPATAPADDDDTSSSGTSSESESESEGEGEASAGEAAKPTTPPKKLTVDTAATSSPSLSTALLESSRPKSSASVTSLTIKIPPVTPAKVHPLEALYKRPAGATGEAAPAEAQPFSFFGNDDMEDEMEEGDGAEADGHALPMTPFSKQDLEFRNTRSAAPTPDTAHPSRLANFWPSQDAMPEEDEDSAGEDPEEDDEGDTTMANTAANRSNERSGGFHNAFYEKRGDINRSWKQRRKLVHKEKRNRENRARAARAI